MGRMRVYRVMWGRVFKVWKARPELGIHWVALEVDPLELRRRILKRAEEETDG